MGGTSVLNTWPQGTSALLNQRATAAGCPWGDKSLTSRAQAYGVGAGRGQEQSSRKAVRREMVVLVHADASKDARHHSVDSMTRGVAQQALLKLWCLWHHSADSMTCASLSRQH